MKINHLDFLGKFGLTVFGEGQKIAPVHITWKFSLKISARELWPSVSDTSLFNRELGLAPRHEVEEDGRKIVKSELLGFAQEWIEEPWTWNREKAMESIRLYRKGLAKTVRSNFFLEDTDNGVDFFVNFSWVPSSHLWSWVLKMTAPLLESKFKLALRKIEDFTRIQRQGSAESLKMKNNPYLNVNMPELEKVRFSLRKLELNPQAVEGLIEFIKSGDDVDLFRIRVIDLARAINQPKRDVLVVCLSAVRLGLLTISWDVICPHCRGVRVAADSLGKISAKADCLVCDIDFETDSLESIEVTFHVQPQIRKVEEILFCAAEPAKKDHILIQRNIAAGETFDFAPRLNEGRHRIRLLGQGEKLIFEVLEDAPDQLVEWSPDTVTETLSVGPRSKLRFSNTSEQVKILTLEQLWWKDNILHPADVFSIQGFQDVFSRESLNSDVKLSLGRQVLMFTDIVNSTGFYVKSGDAAAFNEVKTHFQFVFEEVNEHDGAVIKTIGDSVMACFQDPGMALQAAIAIQKKFDGKNRDTILRLRVSLHVGNVIAVHLSQGLDLFGMTVNKAAKLQSCAKAGEVAMSREIYDECLGSGLKGLASFISEVKSVKVSDELRAEALVLNCDEMHKAYKTLAEKSA